MATGGGSLEVSGPATCISLDHCRDIISVTYCVPLNCIIVGDIDGQIHVVDAHSYELLKRTPVAEEASPSNTLKCECIAKSDCLIVTCGQKIGMRKAMNGIFLLDTILQTPVQNKSQPICIDLQRHEAERMIKYVENNISSDTNFENSCRKLYDQITEYLNNYKEYDRKSAKWSTCSLTLQGDSFLSTLAELMNILEKKMKSSLPLLSSLMERVSKLCGTEMRQLRGSDRSIMYAELTRLKSFKVWPHMNYKWAVPRAMAEAGFFHQPNSLGDDRVNCFTCNSCLINWEPSDEPWSEHERHCPNCPYVKNEYTKNIPSWVSLGTSIARYIDVDSTTVSCISNNLHRLPLIATAIASDTILIWNVMHDLQLQFEINLAALIRYSHASSKDNNLPLATQISSCDESKAKLVDDRSADENQIANDVKTVLDTNTNLTNVLQKSRYAKNLSITSMSFIDSIDLVRSENDGNANIVNEDFNPNSLSLVCGVSVSKEFYLSDRLLLVILTTSPQSMAENNIGKTDINSVAESGAPPDEDNWLIDISDYKSNASAIKDDESDYSSLISQMLPCLPDNHSVTSSIGTRTEDELSRNDDVSDHLANNNLIELQNENILQVVQLPCGNSSSFVISFISTTSDNKYVIVVVSPHELPSGNNDRDNHGFDGGYLFVYEVVLSENVKKISKRPLHSLCIDSVEESIVKAALIPRNELRRENLSKSNDFDNYNKLAHSRDIFIGATKGGSLHLFDAVTLQVIASYSFSELILDFNGEQCMQLSYCAAVQKLCIAFKGSQLHFLDMNKIVHMHNQLYENEIANDVTDGLKTNEISTTLSQELSSKIKDLMLFASSLVCRPTADKVQVITPAGWVIFQPSRKRESIVNIIDDSSNWCACKYDGISPTSSGRNYVFELVLSRPSYVSHVNVKVVIPEEVTGKYEIRGALHDSYNYVNTLNDLPTGENPLQTKLHSSVNDEGGKTYRAKVSNIGLVNKASTVLYLTLSIRSDSSSYHDGKNSSNMNPESSMKSHSWHGLMVYLNAYSFLNESAKDIVIRNSLLNSEDIYTSIIESLAGKEFHTGNLGTSLKSNHEMISCTTISLDLLIKILAYRAGIDASALSYIQHLQLNLERISQNYIIFNNRSCAHLFARLFIQCLTSIASKSANSFQNEALRAFLRILPKTSAAVSFEALQWYFLLISNCINNENRDTAFATCCQFLSECCSSLSSSLTEEHTVLRSLFGLYGNPLEATIYSSPLSLLQPLFTNSMFDRALGSRLPGIDYCINYSELSTYLETFVTYKDFPSSFLEAEPLFFKHHAVSSGAKVEIVKGFKSINSGDSLDASNEFFEYYDHDTLFEAPDSIDDYYLDKELEQLIPGGNINMKPYSGSLFEHKKSKALLRDSKKSGIDNLSSLPRTHEIKLSPPPSLVLIVEKIYSGSRHYVTIDFGRPIALTDVVIPSSSYLSVIYLDAWLDGDNERRLSVSTEIGKKNFILNDIVPPVLCRFVKISIIARSLGTTGTSVRISLGNFYGISSVLPWQNDMHRASINGKHESNNLERQIFRNLEEYRQSFHSFLDDLCCRYEIACSYFREILNKSVSGSVMQRNHFDRSAFTEAYCTCIKLQLQLNTGSRILERLDANAIEYEKRSYDFNSNLCLQLINTLLSIANFDQINLDSCHIFTKYMTRDFCKSLFIALCVNGSPLVCVRTGALLLHICGSQPWWGEFLADILYCCYSNIWRRNLHNERLFSLLVDMGRRSIELSNKHSTLHGILQFTYKVLTTRHDDEDEKNSIDFNLLYWTVIFISELLDGFTRGNQQKNDKDKSRWNFLLIKEASNLPTPPANPKQKLKRSYFSNANNGIFKISPTLKEEYKDDNDGKPGAFNSSGSTNATLLSENLEHLPIAASLAKDSVQPVVKELIAVILSLDVVQCEDIFTVICMVIARLCLLSSPAIVLAELLTEDQLLALLHQATSHQRTAPWVSHSLSCLLLDVTSASSRRLNSGISSPKRKQTDTRDNSVKSKNSSNTASEANKPSKSSNLSQIEQSESLNITLLEESHGNSSFNIWSYESGHKSASDPNNRGTDPEQTTASSVDNQICLDLRLNDQMGQIAEIKLMSRCIDHGLFLKNCLKGPILRSNSSSQNFDNTLTGTVNNVTDNTAVMLSKTFNNFFQRNFYNDDDLKFLLKLWLQLSVLLPFSNWKQTHLSLVMNKETIGIIIKRICRKQSISVSIWHVLFKCLIIIYETYNDTPDELLQELLIHFFSAVNSTDKSEHKIGQSVILTVNQFLVALAGRDADLICSEVKYKRIMLKVLVNLTNSGNSTTPKGIIYQQSGPLDAQVMFLKYMIKNMPTKANEIDLDDIIQLYRNTSLLILSHIISAKSTSDNHSVLFEQILLTLLAYCTRLARLSLVDNLQEDQHEVKNPATVADIVLDEPDIITVFLLILNQIDDKYIGMKISGGVALKLTKHHSHQDMVVSIADWVLMLMCALFKGDERKLVKSIIEVFNGKSINNIFLKRSITNYLSDALFLFVQLVLEHEASRTNFMESGGGELLCHNFLESANDSYGLSVQLLPPVPNLLCDPQVKSAYAKYVSGNLVNFAPFCKIVCSSSRSSSPNILLTSSLRSRRPRSALWRFQFNTGESSCDLILELPHVILLSELHITPYVYSLLNSPSAAAIEISDNKALLSPVSYPVQCCGLKVIKLKLPKPEIARCIRIQLLRPRDSDNIGLMQIAVLGRMPFLSEDQTVTPNRIDEDFKSSLYWLGLIYSCLNDKSDIVNSTLCPKIASMPSFIHKCARLLGVNSLSNDDHIKIEQILLRVASSSPDCALSLLRMLLYQNRNSPLLSYYAGASSVYTIYQLGISDVPTGRERLKLIAGWLENISGKTPSILLRTVASILWQFKETECRLCDVINVDLIKSLCNTALSLNRDRESQKAIGLLICAICHAENSFTPVTIEYLQLSSIFALRSENEIHGRLLLSSFICQSTFVVEFILQQEIISKFVVYVTKFFELLSQGQPNLMNEVRRKCSRLVTIIDFISELCLQPKAQQWFGDEPALCMWNSIIKGLCTHQDKPLLCQLPKRDRIDIETATILLVKRFTSHNYPNQQKIVDIIYRLLAVKNHDDGKSLQYPRQCIIPNFFRKLLAQVILRDECINLQIRYFKPLEEFSFQSSLSHPRFTIDRKKYLFEAKLSDSIHTLIGPLLNEKNNVIMDKKLEQAVQKQLSKTKNAGDVEGYGVKMVSIPASQRSLDQLDSNDDNDTSDEEGSYVIYFGDFAFLLNSKAKKCTISQILQYLIDKEVINLSQPIIELYVCTHDLPRPPSLPAIQQLDWSTLAPLPSFLSTFIKAGCAQILGNRIIPSINVNNIYSYLTPILKTLSTNIMAAMPPHSLLSFGMFLNLNGFAEKLLSNETSARWLFRLTSGVEISTEGGNISTVAGKLSLPLKPFTALESLFHEIQFSCSEGIDLRTEAIELGIMHLLITCLKIFGHLEPFISIDQNSETQQLEHSGVSCSDVLGNNDPMSSQREKSRDHDLYYMAKGTGFGTGSIASNWDVDQLLIVQQIEESHINAILNVITSFLEYDKSTYLSLDTRVKDTISTILKKLALLFKESNFVVFINNCLRNDSVLDIAHHIPMYQSLLNVVRNIAKWPTLIPLLAPDVTSSEGSDGVVDFIKNLKSCIEIYLGRLRPSKKGTFKNGDRMIDEGLQKENKEDQDRKNIASLIPNILTTLEIVENGIASYRNVNEDMPTLVNTNADINEEQHDGDSDQNYVAKMRSLQFDTYCITTETDENETIFNVRYHYASAVRSAIANGSDSGSSERARRLAQEAAALSNSLPLSASSSVFVRCDEERLDIMKVIVTGPSGTPYANGCFEFDTYFPPEYPNVPMQITLITTGNHTVRFNPNLYNEGKVCLSILNTWVGRPEEKWSPQTSNFLQVLVSIQSLILVSEPYFNEPGYERSYNTPHGQQASLEYSANIRQATVRWAMLEQLRNPPSGFEDVIQSHFAMKRSEILKQCQNWREEYEDIVKNHSKKASKAFVNSLELLKKHINKLQEELKKL